jgi:hypothetical protein
MDRRSLRPGQGAPSDDARSESKDGCQSRSDGLYGACPRLPQAEPKRPFGYVHASGRLGELLCLNAVILGGFITAPSLAA